MRPDFLPRIRLTIALVLLVAIAQPASRYSPQLHADERTALVIKDTTLFDSTSASMLPERTIVIVGDTIRAVSSPQEPIAIPRDAHTIDGSGKFVIPGLIDAHVHLVHLAHFMHVTGDEFLPMFLAAGVTSVRSTGDPIVAQVGVQHYADKHPQICPRVFTCSPLLDRNPPIHRDTGYALTDPAKVPAFVNDMVRWKVTSLKIYAGTPRNVGQQIITYGHKHGLKVTAHLGAYSAQDAAADGIDCLEHIESVFDFSMPSGFDRARVNGGNLDLENPRCQALIELLAQQKVAVDPTLVVFRNMLYLNDEQRYSEHPDVALCPARMREYWNHYSATYRRQDPKTLPQRRRLIAKYQELALALHRADVTVLVGTDAPEPFVPPGYSMHQELEMLVEAGMTPAEALRAATADNARILGQEQKLGRVAAGHQADLVVLSADPTKAIQNTRKIDTVIRGGIVCRPAEVLNAVPRE
ncbi:MAG: amidohydrolase family protein [Planctomycetes bacterium]|nr:amidohydrolase family protein [Planctomycetota bacterium]